MKVKHKADKKNLGRINRFYRTAICLIDRHTNWLDRYILVKKPNGAKMITRIHWEDEQLEKGLPCLSMFYQVDNGSPIHVKAGTVKAAVRQVKKLSKFLAHGVKFKDMGGWVDYSVTFTVDNKNYNEEIVKEILYKDIDKLPLPYSYSRLSGDVDFDRLVICFRELGYFVSVELIDINYYKFVKDFHRKDYWSAYVTGFNLEASFCTDNDYQSYTSLNNKIGIEAASHFNKWSRVPYSVPIPTDDIGVAEILMICDFVKDIENGFYCEDNEKTITIKPLYEHFKKYEY